MHGALMGAVGSLIKSYADEIPALAGTKYNSGIPPKDYGVYLQKHPGKRAKHKIRKKRVGRL